MAAGWAGLALHLLVGYPYAVSGLVAPPYGVLALWAVWAALLVVAVRLRPRRPLLVPLVPVVAFGLWLGGLTLGELLLGWQP
ncbi:MAG: hypothetical protein M3P93_03630 [Actinomycetota bacterium]|nr:hypothetical protein [Actinomycetota bacterium]